MLGKRECRRRGVDREEWRRRPLWKVRFQKGLQWWISCRSFRFNLGYGIKRNVKNSSKVVQSKEIVTVLGSVSSPLCV